MDWDLAIRRNREALLRILAALFSLVALPEGEPAGGSHTLPRHLHAYALRILRAAESAIRRLVVIAAREVAVTVRSGGEGLRSDLAALRKAIRNEPAGAPAAIRIPAFPLLDPLRKFSFDPPRRSSKFMPRICVVGYSEPAPLPEKPVLSPDDPVDAASLCRRLLSSRRALANLPREARRLARWQARRRLRPGPGRVAPLRFGGPPGSRKRPIHAVDDILKECHALALDVLSPPDTS
ncbi:MAG: hypothetical protein WDZ83_04615 [Rhizobiaceae bacterium]